VKGTVLTVYTSIPTSKGRPTGRERAVRGGATGEEHIYCVLCHVQMKTSSSKTHSELKKYKMNTKLLIKTEERGERNVDQPVGGASELAVEDWQ